MPIKKFASSPTPPVVVVMSLMRFLIRQTKTPDVGPSEKDAKTAGSSEKSTARKVGRTGRWNSSSCKTAASAAKTAVHATKRALNLIFFIKLLSCPDFDRRYGNFTRSAPRRR